MDPKLLKPSHEAPASLANIYTHLSLLLFFFFNRFIYLFLVASGVRCYAQAFSSHGEQGLLFVVVPASHYSGFSCCGARALGAWVSVVVARRLSSCGSRALEHRLSSCGTRV